MPVIKVGNKWKIGKRGKAMYSSKVAALKAYKGYLFKESNRKGK
jgi:hypothetical protein